jgi:glycosyltransferase involved in cell wall biosynthesis
VTACSGPFAAARPDVQAGGGAGFVKAARKVTPTKADSSGQQDACKARVAILLSTFNGSRFLGSMLESLTSQTTDSWVMYWRDDGSDDNTTHIVKEYFANGLAGKGVEVSDQAHLGTLASYMHLLTAACRGDAHYFAFADQDDVWLPCKLARGIEFLETVPSHIPALYCGRQTLVDVDLRPIGLSPNWTPAQGIASALTQNIATGCTVMLNRTACDLILQTAPPPDSVHDWWCYLVISAAMGTILYDPVPMILYRQHGENQIGANSGSIARACLAIRRGRKQIIGHLRSHVTALLNTKDLLCESARLDLKIIDAALSGRLSDRIKAVRLPGFRRQSPLESMLFCIWFLLG